MTAVEDRSRHTIISKPSLSTPDKVRGSASFLRSPVQKGNFFSSGVGGSSRNLYSTRAKNEDFLKVLAEDGLTQLTCTFPGS